MASSTWVSRSYFDTILISQLSTICKEMALKCKFPSVFKYSIIADSLNVTVFTFMHR